MKQKSKIIMVIMLISIVLLLLRMREGLEKMYYIPSEDMYISVCQAAVSYNYYIFFSKGHCVDASFSDNWIKCDSYGRNQFLTLQFDPDAPDYVYNYLNRGSADLGFSRKIKDTNAIFIQGSVEAIMKVHSESFRFMIFNSIEDWSGPNEFPEYGIGDYPPYNNPGFELLLYDEKSSPDSIKISKKIPVWSKRLTIIGWLRKAARRGIAEP